MREREVYKKHIIHKQNLNIMVEGGGRGPRYFYFEKDGWEGAPLGQFWFGIGGWEGAPPGQLFYVKKCWEGAPPGRFFDVKCVLMGPLCTTFIRVKWGHPP